MGSDDLSGQWNGEYFYLRSMGPVTPFIAIIEDLGGRLSGTIIEPDTIEGGTLEAEIAGTRYGSGIDFTKTYLPAGSVYYNDPVDYVGSVSSDGQTVRGMWSLLEWDGTFELRREFTRQELLERDEIVMRPQTIER
ncbi:MAG: hypothetical protein WA957_10355 [Alteraurantiacibacter sp.]